jgi:hypothetical protein
MLDDGTNKEFWKEVSRKKPAGKPRNRLKGEVLNDMPNCSLGKNDVQREDAGVIGGRNHGRLWLGKGSKSHRRKTRRRKMMKKKKMVMMMMMMMMMTTTTTTTTINAY